VLQAAALDMHSVDERPRAALPTVAAALWAAARRPFDYRLNANKCLLVPSAALRLQVEVSEKVALSSHGSAFRPFAQMCAWLAHLVVAASLPREVRSEALHAFKKLTAVCEELGQSPETAPCDPEGLCTLAMAIALVAREEGHGFGVDALEGLACVCVQHAMDDAFVWRPQQLSVLASAYAAAEVQHEGLFRKIGMSAERHTVVGSEWTTEHLLKLLQSAWQLGQLETLEPLIRGLQSDSDHELQRCVSEAPSRHLPLLFTVLVLVQDGSLLEDLMQSHRSRLHTVSIQGLVSMLREWPSWNGLSNVFTSFKSAVVREAIALALRNAPSSSDLQMLVVAAADDTKALDRLNTLAASPAILASLPSMDRTLQELHNSILDVLGTFTSAGVDAPRIEAAHAARLVMSIDRSADVHDFAPVALSFQENMLITMPAFVEALAEALAKADLPKPGDDDAPAVRRLIERLVSVAATTGCRDSTQCESSDAEFDGWIERLERSVCDDRVGYDRRLDWLEQHSSRWLSHSVRDALGPAWLGTLLIRSKKLTWHGGKSVRLEPPRPRAAIKNLADVAGSLLWVATRTEVDALQVETVKTNPYERDPGEQDVPTSQAEVVPSTSRKVYPYERIRQPKALPGALIVSGGVDKGMGETLGGTYIPCSANHSRAVYRRIEPRSDSRVLLYYWDDRHGEDQRGWWFGPEVGGEEVWVHNASPSTGALPPTRGWRVLHSNVIDPLLTVTRIGAPSAGVPSSIPSKRSSSDTPVPPMPPPRPRGTAGMSVCPSARTTNESSARPRLGRAPTSAQVSSGHTSSGVKRPRVDVTRAGELRAWLESLDDGAGAMLQYFDVLASEFDADLAQIAAAKVEGGERRGILGAVDPSFWETVRVAKTGHKMLFARGIAKF